MLCGSRRGSPLDRSADASSEADERGQQLFRLAYPGAAGVACPARCWSKSKRRQPSVSLDFLAPRRLAGGERPSRDKLGRRSQATRVGPTGEMATGTASWSRWRSRSGPRRARRDERGEEEPPSSSVPKCLFCGWVNPSGPGHKPLTTLLDSNHNIANENRYLQRERRAAKSFQLKTKHFKLLILKRKKFSENVGAPCWTCVRTISTIFPPFVRHGAIRARNAPSPRV
jgi:hypothetical protein